MSVTTLAEARPVARKRHLCQGCRRPIEPGTRYVHQRNVADGHAYHWREHIECFEVASDLMAEWCVDPIEGIDPDDLLAELNRRSEAPR